MPSTDRTPAAKAQVGFWIATSLVVGNMIGSGIFLLPAALSPFGADNVPGWILTAAGGITLGLVFAALSRAGARRRRTLRRTPGPRSVTWPPSSSRGATGCRSGSATPRSGPARSATPASSFLDGPDALNTALTTLAFLWALTLVNCVGIRAAGWVQGVTTVLKLLPLVAAVGLADSRACRRSAAP